MTGEPFMFESSNDDLRFYEERARQENAAVEAATCGQAASAHRLLAIQYEAQIRALRDSLQQAGAVHLEMLPCCDDAQQ